MNKDGNFLCRVDPGLHLTGRQQQMSMYRKPWSADALCLFQQVPQRKRCQGYSSILRGSSMNSLT